MLLRRKFIVFNALEECFDEVRLDYTLLGDLEGLERHSGLSSRYPASNLYRTPVKFLSTPCEVDETWLCKEIWSWIQKGKARAMSEFMGNSHHITARISDQIGPSDPCRGLRQEERELIAKSRTVEPSGAVALRQQIKDIRARVSKIPELNQLMAIRRGSPATLQDLSDISGSVPGQKVYYVDWFEMYSEVYIMTIASAGKEPDVCYMRVPETSVRDFIQF
jgi:hypothetical protein